METFVEIFVETFVKTFVEIFVETFVKTFVETFIETTRQSVFTYYGGPRTITCILLSLKGLPK